MPDLSDLAPKARSLVETAINVGWTVRNERTGSGAQGVLLIAPKPHEHKTLRIPPIKQWRESRLAGAMNTVVTYGDPAKVAIEVGDTPGPASNSDDVLAQIVKLLEPLGFTTAGEEQMKKLEVDLEAAHSNARQLQNEVAALNRGADAAAAAISRLTTERDSALSRAGEFQQRLDAITELLER